MTTTEEAPEPRRRSHSQLNEFGQCSERFRLKRIIRPRPPERPAAWLAHGNAFHETYQQWELSGRTLDFRSHYDALYDSLIESMREVQPDFDLWMKPFRVRKVVEHIASAKARGLEQIDNFLVMMRDHDWEAWEHEETATPGVEVPFDIMLGDVRVIGYIDFVREHADGLSVLDFKTGNRVSAYTQLGLYKYVMETVYGLKITHGEYFYTKDCTLSPPIDLSRYTEDYLIELYSALNRGVENEVFIPNPGDHCGLCPVSRFCREMGDLPVPLDWESVKEPWWGDPNKQD